MHQDDTYLHKNDTDLHQDDNNLHQDDTDLHQDDIDRHQADTDLHQDDIDLHEDDTDLHQDDTDLHQDDEGRLARRTGGEGEALVAEAGEGPQRVLQVGGQGQGDEGHGVGPGGHQQDVALLGHRHGRHAPLHAAHPVRGAGQHQPLALLLPLCCRAPPISVRQSWRVCVRHEQCVSGMDSCVSRGQCASDMGRMRQAWTVCVRHRQSWTVCVRHGQCASVVDSVSQACTL